MKKASYERELYIDKFVRNSNISGASVFLVSGTQDAQPKYYVDTLIYRYLRNRTDECAVYSSLDERLSNPRRNHEDDINRILEVVRSAPEKKFYFIAHEAFFTDTAKRAFAQVLCQCPNSAFIVIGTSLSKRKEFYEWVEELKSGYSDDSQIHVHEIKLFPFGLQEYREILGDENATIEKYLDSCGIPELCRRDIATQDKRLCELIPRRIDTILKKDGIDYNPKLSNWLIDYLMLHLGEPVSVRQLCDALSTKMFASHSAMSNHLQRLCEYYLFYRLPRYDINRGKEIETGACYFLADHSYRRARLGVSTNDNNCLYKNLVAVELMRRNPDDKVFVGVHYGNQIDFVVVKSSDSSCRYVQVCQSEKEAIAAAESLLKIHDAYPKYVIGRTKRETYQYKGVKIIDIERFLTPDVITRNDYHFTRSTAKDISDKVVEYVNFIQREGL